MLSFRTSAAAYAVLASLGACTGAQEGLCDPGSTTALLPAPERQQYGVEFILPNGMSFVGGGRSGVDVCGTVVDLRSAHVLRHASQADCSESIELVRFSFSVLAFSPSEPTASATSFRIMDASVPRVVTLDDAEVMVAEMSEHRLVLSIEHNGWWWGDEQGRGEGPLGIVIDDPPFGTIEWAEAHPSAVFVTGEGPVCAMRL